MERKVVTDGDCMASIALAFGFFWETLWDHAENSELRALREDPNVLFAGDVVTIPEKELKEESCATEQRHRFRRKGVPSRLRLQLMLEGEPRANEPYSLVIDGHLVTGQTNHEGRIEHPIPPNAREGRLLLNEGAEEYTLQLGNLDPVDEIIGIQQRLHNLGLYSAPPDGELGPETQNALKVFQKDNDLEPTGELNEATRNALRNKG